jgi:hypothetical protein
MRTCATREVESIPA